MDNTVEKTTSISIEVGLNKEGVPVAMNWKAADNPAQKDFQPCKAMLLSLFDKETKDTMKIDLWTTEMQVVEMDRFIFQSLRSMADTYYKATNNKELAEQMQQFVDFFGKETEIIPK